MSVILIDDKKVTEYISKGINDIVKNEKLTLLFCQIIQNRQLYSHCLDTARFAVQIGIVIDKDLNLVELAKAGMLHDLGKIDIPVEILNKPGKLNDYEFSIMKTHPQLGYDRLVDIVISDEIKSAVLQHHEKLTGDGYPNGVENMDLVTQIITVSDIFSALTELRSYKRATKPEEAFKIMRENMKGLNDDLITALESKVFSEAEDYRTRRLAEKYRLQFKKSGRLVKESKEKIYLLGDKVVGRGKSN